MQKLQLVKHQQLQLKQRKLNKSSKTANVDLGLAEHLLCYIIFTFIFVCGDDTTENIDTADTGDDTFDTLARLN